MKPKNEHTYLMRGLYNPNAKSFQLLDPTGTVIEVLYLTPQYDCIKTKQKSYSKKYILVG